MIRNASIISLALFVLMSCSAYGDVVLEWNQLMRQTFAAEGLSATPPCNSRTMGMLGGAMFDAVNSVTRSYQSYLGYFDPVTSGASIDVNAAAATAAYQVLSSVYQEYYGAGNPFQAAFDNLYNTQMAAIGAGDAKTRGMEVGASAASAMISFRANDGWNDFPTYSPQPVGTVGRWQPGSTAGAWGSSSEVFLKSQWSNLTPFTMSSSSQFRPAGPDGFTPSNYTGWVQSQAYTDDFNLVKSIGGSSSSIRTEDQTKIAYFWVDGPGTASPPGHWNRIAQTISTSMGLSLEENARLFALLNLAMADTGIASWEAKVFYDTWRPMLAINTADTDGNPDTIGDMAWSPLIPTPSFGAYTSGHSAFSMAGATILAAFFGTDDIAFTTDSESPFLALGYTRSFDSFSQAAQEAGMSRIYGGIHFMSDNVDGAILGENVADNVYSLFFQPVPEPSSLLLLGFAFMSCLRRRRS
ncbi:MAG: phosphatase PAP2 family protein [Prosthecobacter sp.]|nr:phosphatase PAP2 family protein [Prosthecobacter sp.]